MYNFEQNDSKANSTSVISSKKDQSVDPIDRYSNTRSTFLKLSNEFNVALKVIGRGAWWWSEKMKTDTAQLKLANTR